MPVKRNRFIRLVGTDKSVPRTLEAKARALAGLKGFIANLPSPSPEFLIGGLPPAVRDRGVVSDVAKNVAVLAELEAEPLEVSGRRRRLLRSLLISSAMVATESPMSRSRPTR